MALQTFVGSGTSKITSTGTKAYTGVGFTPTALIFFFCGPITATGYATGYNGQGCGFTDGTNNRAMAWGGEQRTSSNESASILSATSCVIIGQETNGSANWTTKAAASFSSFDADGFTLNWGTVDGSNAHYFGFIAIGGSGISVDVDTITEGGTTGNYSTTAPGFQPTFAMFLYGRSAAGSGNTAIGGLGFAVSSSERAMTFHVTQQGQSTPNFRNRLRTTKIAEITAANSDTVLSDSDFVSFDANGFTLNRATDDATDRPIYYLAISGVTADITQITQPASTGADAHTGVGFQPTLLMLVSHGDTAASAGTTVEESFGAGMSSTVRAVAASQYQVQASNDQDVARDFETNQILSLGDPTTPTQEGLADLTSLDADGYTLNYGTSDGSARLILAISMKDAGASPPASTAHMTVNTGYWGKS